MLERLSILASCVDDNLIVLNGILEKGKGRKLPEDFDIDVRLQLYQIRDLVNEMIEVTLPK